VTCARRQFRARHEPAARERQRDKQAATPARLLSWPAVVLAAGVLLSLAANLAQAQPTAWSRSR
jgi:hypothetical protein